MTWFSRKVSGRGIGANAATGAAATNTQLPQLEPGSRIANTFEVVRHVGAGAFGNVYLCNSPQGRCALKALRYLDDAGERQRIRAEALRWAELGVHPNIVYAMAVVEHARTPCIVMEYVEGARTLADVIAGSGGNWRFAIWIGAQAALGLEHAWKTTRLLHRDIKPANILIRPDGRAQIGDFGLATATRTENDASLAARVGTPYYMAPEIWQGATAGRAADIYAFGVTLYETACARWPYERDKPNSLADVARSHQFNAPPDLRALVPDISPEFATLVMECLNKAPERRPPSFALIASELERMAEPEPGESPQSLPPTISISEANRLVNLVGVHISVGQFKQANLCAERARKLEPSNPKVWTAIAAVRSAEGRHKEAGDALLTGLRKSPDADLRFTMERDLSVTFHALGRKEEALHWITRSIASAGAHNRYALLDVCSNIIVDLLPLDEARNVCGRILATDPNAAITWNNYAIACRRSGDFSGAESAARQALKLNPLYAKAWTNLANALIGQERYDAGIKAAERAIAMDPLIGNAYLALHAAHTCLGDSGRAMSALRTGAQRVPNHPGIQEVLKRSRGLG